MSSRSFLVAFALALGAVTVSANPSGTIQCETTSGSPNLDDCQNAINEIRDSEQCWLSNNFGSGCATHRGNATCLLESCTDGVGRKYQLGINSQRAREFAQLLLDECKEDIDGFKVGGFTHFHNLTDFNARGCDTDDSYINIQFSKQ